jgi:predicted enzyme related to lactoylglutathione lyase
MIPRMGPSVSAVLFVKDCAKVSAFYRDVFDARVLANDVDHTVVEIAGFRLLVQQIPAHLAKDIGVPHPAQRREQGSIRLDYPTPNLERSRAVAKLLGGVIDEKPPAWAPEGGYHLGHDPEGNVFCVMSPVREVPA